MKKIASLTMVVLLLLGIFTFNVSAQSNVCVYLNGEKIAFDVQPQIINGRTMVPMRKIFEELGLNVEWDGATQTITSQKAGTTIIMKVDSYSLYKNGVEIPLDVAPTVIDGRTLVPVRAVSESLDASVIWSAKYNVVSIGTNGLSFYENYPNVIDYGKFMNATLVETKMTNDGVSLQYSGTGRDITEYYYALESIGFKFVDSYQSSDNDYLALTFSNSSSPITKINVILRKNIDGTLITISVNGDYNYEFEASKPKAMSNTYNKTPDGFDIYKNADNTQYIRIADFGAQLKGFNVYGIKTDGNGTWKLDKYDAMRDVESYESSGNYITIEEYDYIELGQYLERIYPKVK